MFLLVTRRKKGRDCDSSCSPAWVGKGGSPATGRGQRAEPQVPERGRQARCRQRGALAKRAASREGPGRWSGFNPEPEPVWPWQSKTQTHSHTLYIHHSETHPMHEHRPYTPHTLHTPHSLLCRYEHTKTHTLTHALTCPYIHAHTYNRICIDIHTQICLCSQTHLSIVKSQPTEPYLGHFHDQTPSLLADPRSFFLPLLLPQSTPLLSSGTILPTPSPTPGLFSFPE